ncbi:MAG: hypothetical protein AB4352_05950 [Hormoscilla sp.]
MRYKRGALAIAEELEEMSRDDKITAIGSYGVILMLHLINDFNERSPHLQMKEVKIMALHNFGMMRVANCRGRSRAAEGARSVQERYCQW